MVGQSVQEILKSQYHRRANDNSRYSMRAYARDLKMSPSQLSLLMSGKKGISIEKALHISNELELGLLEKDYFLNQVELSYARSTAAKEIAKRALKKMDQHEEAFQLSKDSFAVISDWYHLGILQVMQIRNYSQYCKKTGEVKFLAQALKTPEADIESALERLKKLGVLLVKAGCHLPVADYVLTRGEVPSAAIRKFHKQMIQKSLIAIETQAVEERFLNTTVLSIANEDYPRIIEDFKNFYCSMMSKYGRTQKSEVKADQVYALAFQLFKIAHLDKEIK